MKATVVQVEKSAEAELRELNDGYIEAFMKSDVNWYREHLADDFVCIESNGTKQNKQEFLKDTAQGTTVIEYKLVEVNVRIYGNVALVQATGQFKRKDGAQGKSRYIDVYVNASGQWQVVSAQITRDTSSN